MQKQVYTFVMSQLFARDIITNIRRNYVTRIAALLKKYVVGTIT